MLCIIAKIDDQATAQLQGLRDIAAARGAPSGQLYGHITLASYVGEDEDGYLAHCRQVLRDMAAFSVEYGPPDVWPATSMIAAAPKKAGRILKLHRLLADGYREQLNEWSQADTWQPHTTLVYGDGLDLAALCGEMRKAFSPVKAKIIRIEFSRVTEDGYEIVDSLELQGSAWSLYILRCGDDTLYTGITNDVPHRLEMHRSGRGAKYTRGRGPLELVYEEKCESYSQALKRERQVKKLSRLEKMKLIGK